MAPQSSVNDEKINTHRAPATWINNYCRLHEENMTVNWSSIGEAIWQRITGPIYAPPKFLAHKSRQCVTQRKSSYSGRILRPSNKNSHETLIHTPAAGVLQVTLQQSTEPQIATAAAIAATTAISAHIIPTSRSYVPNNDTHYLDTLSTSISRI